MPPRPPPAAAVAAALAVLLGACSPRDGGVAPPAGAPPASPPLAAASGPQGSAPAPAGMPNFVALVEHVGPAVVNIVTTQRADLRRMQQGEVPDDLFDFFRRFMPPGAVPRGGGPGPREEQHGLGSGFVIDADGWVLTNAHVVADADDVTVRLADSKREYKAKVVGVDRRTDVALLKVDAKGLPVARLGDSTKVRPGEWVAAIGSPFGFNNTITAGIVSATERALPSETFVPFIQTDVAVNPGNSGGPLINLAGEVIGINSQIYSRTGGYMGVSFAIPIDVAMQVGQQLREHGKVTRGRLGVSIQPLSPELAKSFKLDEPKGALVAAVQPGSPAAKAGLKPGDIITGFAGEPVRDETDLPRRVAATKPGTPVKLEVWRRGKAETVEVTVGELESESVARGPAPNAGPRPANRLGLVLGELPPAGQRALGVDYGLVVEDLKADAASPLRRGDVIVGINGQPIESREDFDRILESQPAGGSVALLVRRGDAALYLAVPVTG